MKKRAYEIVRLIGMFEILGLKSSSRLMVILNKALNPGSS